METTILEAKSELGRIKSKYILIQILSFFNFHELLRAKLISRFFSQFIHRQENYRLILSWPLCNYDMIRLNYQISELIYKGVVSDRDESLTVKLKEEKRQQLIQDLLKFLSLHPNLKSLQISYYKKSSNLFEVLNEIIVSNDTIEMIELQAGMTISNDNMKILISALNQNQRISSLSLAMNNLSSDAIFQLFKFLETNTSLKYLLIKKNNLGYQEIKWLSESLTKNKTLKSIDIGMNQFGSEASTFLAEAMKHNQSIRVISANYNNIRDDGASRFGEILTYNHKINELYLQRNNITSLGIQYGLSKGFQASPTLKDLSLSNNMIEAKGCRYLVDSFLKNPSCSLKTLFLSTCQIGDDGASKLGDLLAQSNTLKELAIVQNEISPNGALLLSKGIKKNKSLVKLDISQNSIKSEGAIAIIHGFFPNPIIKKINFYQCALDKEVAKEINAYFSDCSTIEVLYLQSNNLGEEGLTHIFHLMAKNGSLLKIDLKNTLKSNNCEIWDTCNYALQHNSKVLFLDISENHMGDEGLNKIKEGIAQNKSLLEIGLYRNNLTDLSLIELPSVLKQNNSIEILELEWNHFSFESILDFLIKLGNETPLRFINFKEFHSTITEEQKLKIRSTLSENHISLKFAI